MSERGKIINGEWVGCDYKSQERRIEFALKQRRMRQRKGRNGAYRDPAFRINKYTPRSLSSVGVGGYDMNAKVNPKKIWEEFKEKRNLR